MEIKGRIIKSVGGIYEVETADGNYQCKARGIFRSKGISPYTGDFVRISADDNAEPVIEEIFERKTLFLSARTRLSVRLWQIWI